MATLRARSLEGLGSAGDAENVLEEFIEKNPENPDLEVVFRGTRPHHAKQENASASKLRDWSYKQPPNRAAFAHYHRALFLSPHT